MSFSTTKEIGDYGETRAVHFLRRHGYTVRERNYRSGHYEIDVIASTLFSVVFVEVKTRTYRKEELETLPPPSVAVDREKIRYTRAAAKNYMREHPTRKKPRMDVIEVYLTATPDGKPEVAKVRHIKGAY